MLIVCVNRLKRNRCTALSPLLPFLITFAFFFSLTSSMFFFLFFPLTIKMEWSIIYQRRRQGITIKHILQVLFFTFDSFSHQRLPMVFYLSLSDNKSPQVSRTLLSILVDLNNAAVWLLSIRSLISKSSIPFSNPMVSVPRAPITIGISITLMFHSFF